MTGNVLKEPKKPESSRKKKGLTRLFSSMLDGTILTRDKAEAMLPFFLFLTLMAITLIFNTYYAEKKARQLEALRLEIIELRVRYITTKSELMYLSNQSEVARRLQSRGFVEPTVPPTLLVETNTDNGILQRVFSPKR
jgi:hypothetical protein